MRIFGRERQSLRIKKVRAVRAVYADGEGTEEIEIHLITEEGQRLDLQLHHRLAPDLIGDLTDAYQAIVPPLGWRRNRDAEFGGFDN